jgi:hypothetical protein
LSDKTLAIIIGLIVAMAFAVLWYRNHYVDRAVEPSSVVTRVPEAEAKRETRVKVRVLSCDRNYQRTEMRGVLLNTGNVELHYVRVRSLWKNDHAMVIGSDIFYALNGEVLAPEQQRPFVAVTELSTATRCNAEAVDWW